jgi:hypothetical protein
MRATPTPSTCLALLLALAPCAAQAQAAGLAHESEWVSYRDVYRAMVRFEKYGGPKNLLQNQLQVRMGEHGPGEGIQLTLAGKSAQLNLPLDALGRTVFPLQKAAYDDNAALVLSRKGLPFAVRPQVTIAPRADGQYDGAELRAACSQALGFARYADAAQRARQCAGIRFVFAKKEQAGARLRRADGSEQVLPVVAGPAFAGDADDGFPGVSYRFANADHALVITYNAPLAIVPVFD